MHGEDTSDPHIPLLLWWAIEDKAVSDQVAVLKMFAAADFWQLPLVQGTIAERIARRYLAERQKVDTRPGAIAGYAPRPEDVRLLVAAMEKEFSGRPLGSGARAAGRSAGQAVAAGPFRSHVDAIGPAAGKSRGL